MNRPFIRRSTSGKPVADIGISRKTLQLASCGKLDWTVQKRALSNGDPKAVHPSAVVMLELVQGGVWSTRMPEGCGPLNCQKIATGTQAI